MAEVEDNPRVDGPSSCPARADDGSVNYCKVKDSNVETSSIKDRSWQKDKMLPD